MTGSDTCTSTVGAPRVVADERLTFGDVADRYLKSYVGKITGTDGKTRWSARHPRPRPAEQTEYHLTTLRRIEIAAAHRTTIRLEAKPVDAITKRDVEAVREARLPHSAVGCNRLPA